jgi:tubulin beta
MLKRTTTQSVGHRRAFIHGYVKKGLETIEFDGARSNMTDLIQEYEM